MNAQTSNFSKIFLLFAIDNLPKNNYNIKSHLIMEPNAL